MVNRSSRAAFAFVCGMAAISTGCDSQVRAKAPVVPSAPAPVVEPPLVLAQTAVVLPAPQPVPPESVPPRNIPEARATQNPVIPVIQAPQRDTPPVRTRPQEPGRQIAPVPAQPLNTADATGGDAAAPLLSGEDLARSDARIQTRLADLRRRVHPLVMSPNPGTKAAANRIDSILRLALQQLKRGDLRQAEGLADRAQTLLLELTHH